MPYHHHHNHHHHHNDPPRDPAFGERVAQRFRDGRDEYHERHDDYEAGRRGLFGKKTSLWYEEQQRLREERRRRHEAREQMREERRKTRYREREERREMRDEHHGHHHHRHHYGDDHPDHQRAHSRDGLGDDPFKRHHGSHHHHRREHRGDRYRDAEFGFDGPAGRFDEDDAFGLGHDPGDHRHFRGEPHRHRAHGGHEADWAKDGTHGFDERHGHRDFDPRAHERGFDGGHGERHFDNGFEKEDPFSGQRRHNGHGHGHSHHRRPEFDRDEPLFFDDLEDDYVAFSDDADFGARGFEGRRPRGHRHHHQAGDKRFGDGGFDDLYPSLSPFDEFDSESDNDTIRPGRAKQAGDGRTHYDVLGVSQDVDQATLDKAAKLARVRAHPDKTLRPEMSADEQQTINDEAAKIGEAADILTHSRKRAQYDMELRMGQYPRVDSW